MNYQHWHGFSDPRFGYGSMLTGFIDSLPKSVTLDPTASVNVHMGVPFSIKGWHKGQHRVLFTMWETDTMPASFLRWLSQYDQIIVPCEHNVELFARHHHNVTFVPLGVDLAFWRSDPNPTNTTTFRFHAGGSLWKRKGLDIVVRAFNNLKLPDAELHIKAAPHARDVPKTDLGPNIYLHRNWMSKEAQRDWFRQGDCFIAASRGEGFGLMPLQAIALGVPTILSDTTGQSQFTHLATGVIPCGKSTSETIGLWDEPDISALTQLMLDHYHNREAKQAEASSKASGAKQFSWRKATEKLVKALPEGQLLDKPEWVEPMVKMLVTLNRNLKCDIGKQSFDFKKGVTYEVSENVHQVLFDAKVLA
jgi:glycosyltransferase involved in cell wall biosynthesis